MLDGDDDRYITQCEQVWPNVIEWSILAQHFVHQQQHNDFITTSSQSTSGSCVVVNVVTELATVSIIHMQKNSKY